MRPFVHKVAGSFEEASAILKNENAEILAGGTDILNAQEQAILKDHLEQAFLRQKNILPSVR